MKTQNTHMLVVTETSPNPDDIYVENITKVETINYEDLDDANDSFDAYIETLGLDHPNILEAVSVCADPTAPYRQLRITYKNGAATTIERF